MPVEADVRFLNIDLLLVGRFDRDPLLGALGHEMLVVHDDAEFENEKCLVLEVLTPGLDLPHTLMRLLKWAQGLSGPACRSWATASRRIFDIGIQGGVKPHDSHWSIRQEDVAALAKLGAEVMLTVYAAEWNRGRTMPAVRGGARSKRPRRS